MSLDENKFYIIGSNKARFFTFSFILLMYEMIENIGEIDCPIILFTYMDKN